MKQLTILPLALLFASLLSSCSSSSTEVTPSQNSALNSISNSNAGTKKEGVMQKSLNSWLKNDWEPTVAKDKTIQKKYMQKKSETKNKKSVKKSKTPHYVDKKNKNFTLQEYVDKATAYMKAKPNDYNSSNVKKLETMPVIGN